MRPSSLPRSSRFPVDRPTLPRSRLFSPTSAEGRSGSTPRLPEDKPKGSRFSIRSFSCKLPARIGGAGVAVAAVRRNGNGADCQGVNTRSNILRWSTSLVDARGDYR